ncbi:hypothetical protein [Nocardia salmonicida]|uniref:hypothetical protein n=1 Tax=Nocardia salmonicida TaxID=53431 RepID=UPI0037922433
MAGSKKPAPAGAVAARKLARERMAAAQDERRKLEELNTEDLATFFVQSGKVDDAARKRDAAIAAAHTAFSAAESTAHGEQAAALGRIRDRGTAQTELAGLTGLTAGEVQRLLKAASAAAPVVAAPKKAASKPQPAASKAADSVDDGTEGGAGAGSESGGERADSESGTAAHAGDGEPLGVGAAAAPASAS